MTGHTNSCGVTISKVKRGGESIPVSITRSIAIAVKQQPHLTQPFPGYVTLLFKYNYNLQYCLCTYAEFCMNNNYYKYKSSENFERLHDCVGGK